MRGIFRLAHHPGESPEANLLFFSDLGTSITPWSDGNLQGEGPDESHSAEMLGSKNGTTQVGRECLFPWAETIRSFRMIYRMCIEATNLEMERRHVHMRMGQDGSKPIGIIIFGQINHPLTSYFMLFPGTI